MVSHEEDSLEWYLRHGRKIAQCVEGEEVVISGVAGRFPKSENVSKYHENLIRKVDMVTSDCRRWRSNHSEVPQRTGKIDHIDRFDTGFFNVHYHQAQSMDIVGRMLLEHTFEAILDAGFHPDEFRGTRTGVFIAACISESEKVWFYNMLSSPNFGGSGCMRSVQAHWISQAFRLVGPSVSVDTACSSSLTAIDLAYRAIRSGKCDAAFVGSGNLCMHPMSSLQFFRLGVLSADGACKSFDKDADGYARSEAVSVMLLQKAKDARRIYARVVHSKTNNDGYKEHGITFPSSSGQLSLITEMYRECNVNPQSINFLEMHATGTRVGDPEEITSMDQFFCQKTNKTLYVGSVKSNHGHTEPVSGLCSIVKTILSMESNHFLPNIAYTQSTMEPLVNKRLVVITDNLPWRGESGLVGINNFGFGGANCHVLLKKHCKAKNNGGLSDDELPRLVCYSGRGQDAVDAIRNDLAQRSLDKEFVALLHAIFAKPILGHSHRGFSIISKQGEILSSSAVVPEGRGDLRLLLSGPSQVFLSCMKSSSRFPAFSRFLQRIKNALPDAVDITTLFEGDWTMSSVDFFTAATVGQLVFVDLCRVAGLEFNSVDGYFSGAIAAAYADGSVSLEGALVLLHHVVRVLFEGSPDFQRDEEQIRESLRRVQTPQHFVDRLFHTSRSEMRLTRNTVILNEFRLELDSGIVDLSSAEEPLLETLGKLYELGFSHQPQNLYEPVEWPVSAGTPMISPLIRWRHDDSWFVPYFSMQENVKTGEASVLFSTKEKDWNFVTCHVVDGRNLLPATGYLNLVWNTFSMLHDRGMTECSVLFREVRFHRATNLTKDAGIKLFITIERTTGKFELAEFGQLIVSGKISLGAGAMTDLPEPPSEFGGVRRTKRDIYKELKLRGYQYSGPFQSIAWCDLRAAQGEIEWHKNWTALMDSMLQMMILQEDTLGLYLPTYIDQIYIDTDVHERVSHRGTIPIRFCKSANIIRCGGIEIKGLKAVGVAKRKTLNEPVLESYQFVPLVAKLDLETAIRVNAQIVLENINESKFKAVELLDDAEEDLPVTLLLLQRALRDEPLVQPDLCVLTSKPVTFQEITVKDKSLSSESRDYHLLTASRILSRPQLLKEAQCIVKDGGFFLAREALDFLPPADLNVITIYETRQQKLILFRKEFSHVDSHVVDVSNVSNFAWLPVLQSCVRENREITLFSSNADSGVLGLAKCLRSEIRSQKSKCIFVIDSGRVSYREHLRKGLSINVYKNGCWGTYRHLPIAGKPMVWREHVFGNVLRIGDMSSLTWVEGPFTSRSQVAPECTLVNVTVSALNFRDVMLATGRIHLDSSVADRTEQETMQGLEFAGMSPRGKRIMGIARSGALASLVVPLTSMTLDIPERWTFEEAATVPITYSTTLLGVESIGRIKRGETILIHAGSGGIGISAINVALHYKCVIFTTVGSADKKNYLLTHFPEIPEDHIGNSRDVSFERLIMKKTRGRGVDLILNSLTEEKLQASVRCLAPGGRLIEIGKFDLQSNNKLDASCFADGRSYHGVMLDLLFNEAPSRQRHIMSILERAIQSGYVKPLPYTVFEKEEVESAFRYLAGGKHIGKILLKIRHNDEPNKMFEGVPRYYCEHGNCSIIIGGLGGFGLELADWLVLRGCKKLVLVSRTGLKNGYEAAKILNWTKYGVKTIVSTADVTTEDGCVKLMKQAGELGPIENIFNLAVVLRDSTLENQSERNFEISFAPKVAATKHLDAVSRTMCPRLRKFVVFSSVVSGRGNAGQSNYGMANSAMERICERRQRDGYPGLAVQWGAIGDVGLVASMQNLTSDTEVGGTLQQGIASCLNVLDVFLSQSEPVVSSVVVAEKKGSRQGSGSVIDEVMSVIGIKDVKTIGANTSLSQLGMDSIMAIEIKQILETEYEIVMTPEEVRGLTVDILQRMGSSSTNDQPKQDPKYDMLHLFILNVAEEANDFSPILRLKSLVPETASAPFVFVLPGIDGRCNVIKPLAANLTCHVFCVQYEDFVDPHKCTIEDATRELLTHLENYLSPSVPFTIVAYSFSCVTAVHLVSVLEQRGYKGHLILIDGSHSFIKDLVASQVPDPSDENVLETYVTLSFAKSYLTLEEILKMRPDVLRCKNLRERADLVLRHSSNRDPKFLDRQRKVLASGYGRIRAITTYEPALSKLNTSVTLIKPEQQLLPDFPDDYNLQDLFHSPLRILTFEGNHMSILKNLNLASAINTITKDNFQGVKGGGILTKNFLTQHRATVDVTKQI